MLHKSKGGKSVREIDAYACCSLHYPYRDIRIYYSTDLLNDWIDRNDIPYIEHALIHEMCHYLVEHMGKLAKQRNVTLEEQDSVLEQTVDNLAHIFGDLL